MATHHSRALSNHSKRQLPPHARPSKPAPLSKRSHSHGSSRKVAHKEEVAEDEEVMATSFLNFCTTCEKQIIVPSNSVLYCSESCRKKDTEKQFASPHDWSPPTTPFFANFSCEDLQHPRDIVPPRSPTQVHSKRSSCAFSELSSDDNTTSSDERTRKDSEASRYLRQFQATAYSSETPSTVRHSRPRYNRSSTSQATLSAAPSLSHTPSSTVSFSLPYTPSTRPLPPRTNPHSYGAKSIDLVTPWAQAGTYLAPSSPPMYSLKTVPIQRTEKSAIEGEIMYAKSPVHAASPADGSLGRLLATRSR